LGSERRHRSEKRSGQYEYIGLGVRPRAESFTRRAAPDVSSTEVPRTRRPLRILFATARYVPYSGGTEIHTYQIAKRLVARGAEVTVATTRAGKHSGPRESLEEGIRVVRVRAWPPNRDYYIAPALAKIVRTSRTDIIHCQGYHTLVAPLVMLTALTAGIPYVVTLHSGGHSSQLRHRLRPLQAWLLRPLLSRAHRLIAVSAFEADLFARRLRLRRSGFVVIPSGVDMPAVPAEPQAGDPPLVISVGRLESYKGHQQVMQAVPALRAARGPGIRVHFVGSGVYEAQLWRLARQLGVADMVEIGSIAAEDCSEMARRLSQAAVVASLSSYESQGLAMQEALALGRPLVVRSDTALGELTRYPNVRAVEPDAGTDRVAEAIIELLDAPSAQPPRMPTWDECASAHLKLYDEIAAHDA
jgi:glycosyltransferase involved in cell wall biosynthesis